MLAKLNKIIQTLANIYQHLQHLARLAQLVVRTGPVRTGPGLYEICADVDPEGCTSTSVSTLVQHAPGRARRGAEAHISGVCA